MSLLFTLENKIVKPTVEALLISPFREIWERDENPGKFTATSEFTYIEFMMSVKKTNPYAGYPKEERHVRLCKDIIGHEEYIPDELVVQGMNLLHEFQMEASESYTYYLSAYNAVKKLQHFFNTFNMDTLNFKTGMPLYKPKDITSAVIDTEKALQNLSSIKQKVNDELFESIKIKGAKIVSPFANPDSL